MASTAVPVDRAVDRIRRSLLLDWRVPLASGSGKASGDGLVDGQLRSAEVAATALYLLAKYVEESFRPWVKRFPDELLAQVMRVYGHDPKGRGNRRPQFIGKFINEYIYDQFPYGVLDELQRVNPVKESGHGTIGSSSSHGTASAAIDNVVWRNAVTRRLPETFK
jgi:hypothetical protein